MKMLVATVILAMAAASPALAQRAQSAPQQGYQSQQNGYYTAPPCTAHAVMATHRAEQTRAGGDGGIRTLDTALDRITV